MPRRSFVTVVATTLLALSALLLSTGPAAAVPADHQVRSTSDASTGSPVVQAGCYGDYCSGKDPEAMGCSGDAYTVDSAWTGSHTVELRWSPSCKTNWSRIGGSYGGSLWVVQSTGYRHTYSGSNGSYRWTAMIYSPTLACRGEAGGTVTAWV